MDGGRRHVFKNLTLADVGSCFGRHGLDCSGFLFVYYFNIRPIWALSLASTDKSSYSLGAAIQNLVRNTSQLFAIAAATAIITSIMIAGGFVGDLSEIANDPTGNTASSFILGAQIVFILSAVFGVGTMFATILVRKHESNE